MEHDFNKLDEMYRVSEKEEIKKFLELGKTPSQYYDEQASRAGKADRPLQVRETLLSQSEKDGL
jgi:hypothetical protein